MKATALEIFKALRKTGFRMGEKKLIALALDLSEARKTPEDIKGLSEKQKTALNKLLAPAVKELGIGPKNREALVGGEDVVYRHLYRFMNETKLFIELDDSMSPAEIRKRMSFVKGFEVERVGQRLKLNGLAIKSRTGDKRRYMKLVVRVAKAFNGPVILSAPRADVIEPALKRLRNRRPLIHLEKEDLVKSASLAEKYDSSLIIKSDNIGRLSSLAKMFMKKGFDRLVFDASGKDLETTLRNFTSIREKAAAGNKSLGFPLMASLSKEKDAYNESLNACALISRYASILVLHTIEPWAILPVLTFRHGLYSDPRTAPMVEPGIYRIGEPKKDSPLLLTSNFALTYYSVRDDLEKAKTSCYILALDTEGLAVTVSLAADKFTASTVKEALEKYKAAEKVSHRKIIIPGFAARVAEAIKEETGWEALVGPNDSSQLAEFLHKLNL